MKKYIKTGVDNKDLEVFEGTDIVWAISQGFTEQEVEQAYDGSWYLLGHAPQQPIAEQNEAIRARRESLFSSHPCSDYKYDYEEAIARLGQDNPATVTARNLWLAEKDKIRNENPYIVEEVI